MQLQGASFRGSIFCLYFFWKLFEVRTGGWKRDSLVVKHHVRQPDVFGGQPDLQHSIKLLRDPSQTIVLPLLKANKKKTVINHSSANHTAGRWDLERSRRRCACLSVIQSEVNMTHQNARKPGVRSVLSVSTAPSSHVLLQVRKGATFMSVLTRNGLSNTPGREPLSMIIMASTLQLFPGMRVWVHVNASAYTWVLGATLCERQTFSYFSALWISHWLCHCHTESSVTCYSSSGCVLTRLER